MNGLDQEARNYSVTQGNTCTILDKISSNFLVCKHGNQLPRNIP